RELAAYGKRVTLSLTPDVEHLLNTTRKEVFHNCSQSEAVRHLIDAGLSAYRTTETSKTGVDEQNLQCE
ncbi:MAG: hypothetical protein LBH28_12185, partial [Oscillospiraceae bacterium]|nr:hypothetical protein [Oscillospiraceae bacterium]